MYQHMTPFNVGVLPIWTILAWTPTVVLFIYLMPNEKGRVHFWLYLLVWSAFTSFVAVILTQLDLLVFLKGGPWIWFVASLIFLYLASKHHLYLQSKRTDKI
jgi:membrane protein YdbS with pleckstrin-like domain